MYEQITEKTGLGITFEKDKYRASLENHVPLKERRWLSGSGNASAKGIALHERLKAARKKRGVTQNQLAQCLVFLNRGLLDGNPIMSPSLGESQRAWSNR